MYIKKKNRKIDLNSLKDSEYIEYKNSVYNRRIAISSIIGVLLTLATLVFTYCESKDTENHIKRMLVNAEELTNATIRASEFAEKSANSAEKALIQSESQFLRHSQSIIKYYYSDFRENDNNPNIEVQFKILGERNIEILNINYCIKFLPKKQKSEFIKASIKMPAYTDSIETLRYNESSKLEDGVKFFIVENRPTKELKYNTVNMGYYLFVEITFRNMTTNLKSNNLFAIYCNYSNNLINKDQDEDCELFIEK